MKICNSNYSMTPKHPLKTKVQFGNITNMSVAMHKSTTRKQIPQETSRQLLQALKTFYNENVKPRLKSIIKKLKMKH